MFFRILWLRLTVVCVFTIWIIACDDSSTSNAADTGDSDAPNSSDSSDDSDDTGGTESNEATNTDSSSSDLPARETDDSETGTGEIENEWQFSMRKPTETDLICSMMPTLQTDWLCTIEFDGYSGVFYIQNDPVECLDHPMPAFATRRAVLAQDGEFTPLEQPVYEMVEHPFNSFFDFNLGAYHFRYDHSDIAEYGTACAPMDCIVVTSRTDGSIIENGCTSARTLPVVCAQVQSDGTFKELVDEFENCDFTDGL